MQTISLAVMVCLLAGCGFPAWRDQALHDVAEGRWRSVDSGIGPSGQLSQTTDFYDASGKYVGYGKVQGGTVEFFNADSSRAGFGKR